MKRPTAKTSHERVTTLRERRAAEGLQQVCVWVYHDDADAVRRYAKTLATRRTAAKKR